MDSEITIQDVANKVAETRQLAEEVRALTQRYWYGQGITHGFIFGAVVAGLVCWAVS